MLLGTCLPETVLRISGVRGFLGPIAGYGPARGALTNYLLFTDCFTIEGDKEREDSGDAHVPSELGDVPHSRFVHKRVHTASSEARFAFFRMGIIRL